MGLWIGIAVTYVVREKRSIRKIYVSGNSEVGLDKINEVLDLKKDTIYDPAKVKRNAEKIHDLYVEKGYYLARVTYTLEKKGANEVSLIFSSASSRRISGRCARGHSRGPCRRRPAPGDR